MATSQADGRSGAPAAAGNPTTMTAVVQDRYGPTPEGLFRVEEVDRPAVTEDEVLVRVHAASVDRGTWHIMAGLPLPIRLAGFGLRRPKYANPGRNLAGTVEAVGADVTGFAPGDEVFGTSTSTFAEYAAARPARLAPKPANLSFEQAATVPVSGATALQAVRDHGRVRAGERVLVIGASGGVGSFAVQIAKASGAEVTGVAGTAKVDLVRALGADHVVDHTREDFADGRIRYDVVVDTGGNARLSRLRRALTPDSAPFADVRRVAAPTLIQWGREDLWIPVAMADTFRAYVPRARVVIYDGVGHLPMEEAPGPSAADARRFLLAR